MIPMNYVQKMAFVSFITFNSVEANSAYQSQDLVKFLNEFHENPREVMEQTPYKENNKVGPFSIASIPGHKVENDWFIHEKDKVRKSICSFDKKLKKKVCATDLSGRAGMEWNDKAENLTDLGNSNISTLSTMDQRKLNAATLSVKPWSDDYWAIYKGGVGYRYADREKPYSKNWEVITDYVREKSGDILIESGLINLLSPAEKYDLLVGDSNYSLTKYSIEEGRSYFEKDGKVETWMGICHGWAPAAFMMDRPEKLVKVLAADGETMIPFYPSDIKALGSLLWAKKSPYTRFIGGRCNKKELNRDADSSRIIDQECFDTNPGTWHKSIVNQIGISDRSFVMDATLDYEVWNQPVYSYSYKYFNPENFKKFDNYKDAVIDLEEFTKDKFKKYRSSSAKKVVGIEMVTQYIAETTPTHTSTDKEDYDYVTSVVYRYDLEIDKNGQIIGGEWYSNKHPDFLWVPEVGARALTNLDNQIENAIKLNGRKDLVWKNGEAIPYAWRENTIVNSRQGIPLGLVVEGLIERSRK